MHQVQDIIDGKKELNLHIIYHKLKKNKIKYREREIEKIFNYIRSNISNDRMQILEKGNRYLMQDEACNFVHIQSNKSIQECSSKFFYQLLIRKIIKEPTAALNSLNINTLHIWYNINDKPIPLNILSTEFKLRHRKLYTGLILHQIDKKIGRGCTVCGVAEETLLHLLIECVVCQEVWRRMEERLKQRCNFKMDKIKDLFTMLFGTNTWKKKTTINGKLINLLLSFLHHVIYISRNFKLFENKVINIWTLFRSQFVQHCNTRHIHDEDWFINTYMQQNNIFQISNMDNSLQIFID